MRRAGTDGRTTLRLTYSLVAVFWVLVGLFFFGRAAVEASALASRAHLVGVLSVVGLSIGFFVCFRSLAMSSRRLPGIRVIEVHWLGDVKDEEGEHRLIGMRLGMDPPPGCAWNRRDLVCRPESGDPEYLPKLAVRLPSPSGGAWSWDLPNDWTFPPGVSEARLFFPVPVGTKAVDLLLGDSQRIGSRPRPLVRLELRWEGQYTPDLVDYFETARLGGKWPSVTGGSIEVLGVRPQWLEPHQAEPEGLHGQPDGQRAFPGQERTIVHERSSSGRGDRRGVP